MVAVMQVILDTSEETGAKWLFSKAQKELTNQICEKNCWSFHSKTENPSFLFWFHAAAAVLLLNKPLPTRFLNAVSFWSHELVHQGSQRATWDACQTPAGFYQGDSRLVCFYSAYATLWAFAPPTRLANLNSQLDSQVCLERQFPVSPLSVLIRNPELPVNVHSETGTDRLKRNYFMHSERWRRAPLVFSAAKLKVQGEQ